MTFVNLQESLKKENGTAVALWDLCLKNQVEAELSFGG